MLKSRQTRERSSRRSSARVLWLAALLLITLPGLAITIPAAAGDWVIMVQYPLPEDVRAGYITTGPDGNLWFTGGGAIGRITPEGFLTVFRWGSTTFYRDIVAGPDGNIWYTWFDGRHTGGGIGRATTEGVLLMGFSLPEPIEPQAITNGPDGALWFTAGSQIGRITPQGVVTLFDFREYSGSLDITAGPDGNLWFTTGSTVARITPEGVITEFDHPNPRGSVYKITDGPDGNLWFTGDREIGRITPQGVITLFPVPLTQSFPDITQGPDGNIWFTVAYSNVVGRITPQGVFTSFETPTTDGFPTGITTGPDGNIWFTTGQGAMIVKLVLDTHSVFLPVLQRE